MQPPGEGFAWKTKIIHLLAYSVSHNHKAAREEEAVLNQGFCSNISEQLATFGLNKLKGKGRLFYLSSKSESLFSISQRGEENPSYLNYGKGKCWSKWKKKKKQKGEKKKERKKKGFPISFLQQQNFSLFLLSRCLRLQKGLTINNLAEHRFPFFSHLSNSFVCPLWEQRSF